MACCRIVCVSFPDPNRYDFPEWVLIDDYFYYAKDIASFADELTPSNIREAYTRGIFPWYMDGVPLPWFCPEERAILEFDELHVSRSLRKEQRKREYTFTIDEDFGAVIRECSAIKRSGQKGTWITDEFVAAYIELHREGMAHSVEVWNANGDLAGGLYGIDAGGVFCGESMFHKEPNTSKLAFLFLADHLKSRGSTWIDAQVMTPHLEAFGAKEISRANFLTKLTETQTLGLTIF